MTGIIDFKKPVKSRPLKVLYYSILFAMVATPTLALYSFIIAPSRLYVNLHSNMRVTELELFSQYGTICFYDNPQTGESLTCRTVPTRDLAVRVRAKHDDDEFASKEAYCGGSFDLQFVIKDTGIESVPVEFWKEVFCPHCLVGDIFWFLTTGRAHREHPSRNQKR